MQNLFIKIRCVSRKQLFFSCCVVCISMTQECWGQYAVENRDCIPSDGANGLGTVSMVYRRLARLVRSRLDGIPQFGGVGTFAESRYAVFWRPKGQNKMILENDEDYVTNLDHVFNTAVGMSFDDRFHPNQRLHLEVFTEKN